MLILIVDDSRTCRRMYNWELHKGGYEIIEAEDGLEALEMVKQHPVDLVVLDLTMPNLSGYEVCERLRSEEFSSHFNVNRDRVLPVIFVTSNETMDSRLEGFNRGGDDYLVKGFKPGTLLASVNRILKPQDEFSDLRALVAHENRAQRNTITHFLREHGIQAMEADSGSEALKLLRHPHYQVDVLITGMRLPDVTGDDFCREIRASGLRSLPIIVVTESGDRRVLLGLFAAGATDYLVSPFEKEELLARIKVSHEMIKAAVAKSREQAQRHAAPALTQESQVRFANTVLHNIGNVLNSVTVSCAEITQTIKRSKLSQVLLAHKLISDHESNLPDFFSMDPRGAALPKYLTLAGQRLEAEQLSVVREIESLSMKVSLMKEVIRTQQTLAKNVNEMESVNLLELCESALVVLAESIESHQIKVIRQFECQAVLILPKVQLTHVLINLIKNAVEAMVGSQTRELTLRIFRDEQKTLCLEIRDSGMGISAENLKKLFEYGFTTKSSGHGFGMSYCANSLREMGGELRASSPGPGQGASFLLLFPQR